MQPLKSQDEQPVRGAITSIDAGILTGWAENIDPARLLALYVGRRRVATAAQQASPGSVRTTFAIDARECPADLLDKAELEFDVAVLGEAPRRIASIRVATTDFLKPSDLPIASDVTTLEGCLDELSTSRVRGWVYDTSRPERQLDIFLFSGERYLGRHVAAQPRPDLAASGRGHGSYGFEITLVAGRADRLTVVAGKPEYWRVPTGVHAISASRSRPATPRWRELPGSVEAFARALTSLEPFPKKAYVLDKVTQGTVPDAFSADYVALSLECLRSEMVATSEAMGGGIGQRLKSWAELRANGARIRRLEELAAAICEGPRLLGVAAKRRGSKS